MITKNSNSFFDLAISRKMYSNKTNLKVYLRSLFGNMDWKNKEVLDVGGGSGLLTFYAASEGAKKAVCLEPEKDGSRNGMIKQYHDVQAELMVSSPVVQLPLTLQEYLEQAEPETFDVVIMHSSINHLDEEACIHLLKSDSGYQSYLDIFRKVHNIMKKNAVLIVTDCSRNNFFNDIGIKNVFVPSIEWHKHQAPQTWVSLFKQAGFKHPTIKWIPPHRLGKFGQLLAGNYLISYLTRSYFKVTVEK